MSTSNHPMLTILEFTRQLYWTVALIVILYQVECATFLLSLRWRHNDNDGVSNHQPRGCLLKRLFRRKSKKTSKLRVTGLCVGNSPGPVNSPHKGPVTRKMFPFDDVIMFDAKYCVYCWNWVIIWYRNRAQPRVRVPCPSPFEIVRTRHAKTKIKIFDNYGLESFLLHLCVLFSRNYLVDSVCGYSTSHGLFVVCMRFCLCFCCSMTW